MKFTLEVEIGAFDGTADKELGRILRFWAGNLKHYDLVPGDGSVIYDSAYQDVGRWSITETSAAG